MLFTSHLFIFLFLPFVILVCWQAQLHFGRSTAIVAMIAASLLFYYSNSQAQVTVLLISVALNCLLNWLWFKTSDEKGRRGITFLLIAGNLACLAYFKYGTFIVGQFHALPSDPTQYAIALPLGISFFTFQQIAYAADVAAGRVKRHRLFDYFFCVLFFPHLVAGPIVNYRELIPQLTEAHPFSFRRIDLVVGISVFIVGLAKKTLLADSFAGFVTPAFSAADSGSFVSLWAAWTSVLAYTFQIYFDFSGYSDMAIGLARIFGLQFPANFASPYKSTSIIEFWRRWHITLSRFLRQYLYIPLGGNRHGTITRYRNLMITMLLGGLWHGAAWNFVLWGGIHGALLAIAHAWSETTGSWPASPRTHAIWTALCGVMTFLAVMIAWVFFRAETLDGAGRILGSMAHLEGNLGIDIFNPGIRDIRFLLLATAAAVIVFLLPNTQELFCRYDVSIPPDGSPAMETPFVTWRANYPWALATAVLAGGACFYATDFPQFLYWGF